MVDWAQSTNELTNKIFYLFFVELNSDSVREKKSVLRQLFSFVFPLHSSDLLSLLFYPNDDHRHLCTLVDTNAAPFVQPRSGELRTQKLKSHLVRTQSLNVLPLKPGVDQFIAIHATLTARDFFLAYFYTSGHSPAFFPKPLPIFPCVGCG